MPKVPYSYDVNGKLVTGNGSLIPICSLSNSSLMPSLTVYEFLVLYRFFSKMFRPHIKQKRMNVILQCETSDRLQPSKMI